MKAFIYQMVSYLIQSTVWIYLTLFLFFSYLFIISITPNNWVNYLSGFWVTFALCFPAVIYSLLRERLKQLTFINALTWTLCFIIYPLALTLWGAKWVNSIFSWSLPSLEVLNNNREFLLTLFTAVIATEIGIQFSNDFFKKIKKRLNGIPFDLEKMILGLLLLLSFLIAGINVVFNWLDQNLVFNFYNLALSTFKLFSFTFQCFLIALGHYIFYYTNHYLLIPKILKEKGIIYYGFSVAAIILVVYPFVVYFIQLLPMPYELGWEAWKYNVHAANSGALPFLLLILTVPIIISNQWFQQANEITTLEKEKANTELNLLKQQINPHFFFNTLNNLYALSLTKDKQTPEVILQLSELMRYVIYRGKEQWVPIEEEIKYLEDYLQLQQIRLHKKMDLQFECDLPEAQIMVPPLLFIVLIENAFKHGIEPAENQSFLKINIHHTSDQSIHFTCINSVEDYLNKESGIGLDNLKKRLALLYPHNHELKINKLKNRFEAELKIPTFLPNFQS